MRMVFGVIVRLLSTKARLIALGALGLGAIGLGIATRSADVEDHARVAFSVVDGYGLGLLVPVVALVFSSAALGEPAEDGTLVYLWLRPLARWKLTWAACLAALALTVPVAVVRLVIAAAATGTGWKVVAASAVGGLLAAAAYSAVFCGIGLRVRRGRGGGVGCPPLWEAAGAPAVHGAAPAPAFRNNPSPTAALGNHPPQAPDAG